MPVMKQGAVKILTAVLVIAVILSSCSNASGSPEVLKKTVSGQIRADDGTVVYSYEADYPEITVPGNKSAAKKINSLINNEIKKIKEPEFDYIAQYNGFVSQGRQYFSGASVSQSFFKTYCDNDLISFEITVYNHEACAVRDTETTRGMTFSLITGDTVGIYDIAADGENFKNKLISETEKQLAKFASEKDTADISVKDALTVIESNGFGWYLSTNSLCVLFAPGDVAPIMYGTLTVEIPLSDYLNQPSNGSTASVSGVSS